MSNRPWHCGCLRQRQSHGFRNSWTLLGAVISVSLAGASGGQPNTRHAPFILFNGTVVIEANASTFATAVCVAEGRIVDVGSDASILSSRCGLGAEGMLVNLRGAMVVPGLTDSHAHLFSEAARRTRADLGPSSSAADAARLAKKFYQHHQDFVNASGGWLLGFGWDQTQWQHGSFPSRKDLDDMFPDVPVYLEHISGHACWTNSKAIEVAAADIPKSGDPPGGHIERDADGKPTGIFSDDAMDAITRHIPPLSDVIALKAIQEVFDDCARHGLTGVHDLNAQERDIAVLQNLQSEGRLPLRVYAFRSGAAGNPRMPMVSTSDGLLTARGVKFFADGAMGSWSAAMLEPYADRPTTRGTLVYSAEELKNNISSWADAGYQIGVHAIGDAANRQVLDVYQDLLRQKKHAGQDRRWRVEHVQILSPTDVPRFAQLGVIPSMQPSHCASDLGYADQRLGPRRAAGGYFWQGLLRSGVEVLPFGSDFPTAGTVPPILGLHAAVTRQTAGGIPKGGWHPEQRVSISRALQGYTADAAYASFREAELGAVKPGYYADLTILDRNLLTVAPQDLLNTTVLGTIVGGRFSYIASDEQLQAVGADDLSKLARSGSPARQRKTVPPDDIATEVGWWWHQYVQDTHEDAHLQLPDLLL
mmetsp:Transcript_49690/g.118377  ORF Transcript_49690/g.118377 Transcript_49690/m.118377 type:complete len:647 (-) Transcript_49690:34-1974(-)